jgi:hypothetical protein
MGMPESITRTWSSVTHLEIATFDILKGTEENLGLTSSQDERRLGWGCFRHGEYLDVVGVVIILVSDCSRSSGW